MVNDEFVNSQNINQLNNYCPYIVISPACKVNGFDKSENSLSEAFIHNSNGGAIAFWGSSRDNFYSCSKELFLGDLYSAVFLSLFYNNDKTLGQVASEAKMCNLNSFHSYYSGNRWIQFSYNLIGDPEFKSMRNYKKVLNHSVSLIKDDIRYYKISVNSEAGRKSQITILSADDYGESDFIVARNVSEFSYEPKSRHVYLSIITDGYEPYVQDIYLSDIDDELNPKIEGKSAVIEMNDYYVSGITNSHTVAWSLVDCSLLSQYKVPSSTETGESISVGIISDLYLEYDTLNSHECSVYEGAKLYAGDGIIEKLLVATIKRGNDTVRVVSKPIARIYGYAYQVSQEATINYPGFESVYISNMQVSLGGQEIFEDSTQYEHTPFRISKKISKTQHLDAPIYVYPEGIITVYSNNLKYCDRVEWNYRIPKSFNFDKESGTISFELNRNTGMEQSFLLEMYYGDIKKNINLTFVQIENEEPSLEILLANYKFVSVVISHSSQFVSNNWQFNVYSVITGDCVFSQTGNLLDDKFTISGYHFGNGDYIIQAINTSDATILTAKCHTSYF